MIGLALGLPAVGKTQALQDYCAAQAGVHRFFVVDRANEWAPDSHRWRGQRWREWTRRTSLLVRTLGHSLVVDGAPWFLEAPASPSSSWLEQLPSSGLVRFSHPWEGEDVAELARQAGSTTYVDDELDLVALQAGWSSNPLRDFAHRGRHLPNARGVVGQVHLLGAARRAQSLHIDVTTLADLVWIFRLKGGRTLERLVQDNLLEESDLDEAATTHPEGRTILSLEPYEYRLWQASDSSSWGQLLPY